MRNCNGACFKQQFSCSAHTDLHVRKSVEMSRKKFRQKNRSVQRTVDRETAGRMIGMGKYGKTVHIVHCTVKTVDEI